MKGEAFHTKPANEFEKSLDQIINSISFLNEIANRIELRINKILKLIIKYGFVSIAIVCVGVIAFVLKLVISIFSPNKGCKN